MMKSQGRGQELEDDRIISVDELIYDQPVAGTYRGEIREPNSS